MSDKKPWHESVALPALMRLARNTYGKAIRKALSDAGYDDIPRNGLYVIGGLALGSGKVPLGRMIEELDVSKQATGQLIDTLVLRGYLERAVDESDRRKLTVTLTERGRAAASVQNAARERIDTELVARMGEENVTCTRNALAALFAIGRDAKVMESISSR